MTNDALINRTKEALHEYMCGDIDALDDIAPQLAYALIRKHEAEERLAKRLEALRTYFDLSEEELGDLTRDERADCVRQHRLICEALTIEEARKELGNG